MVALDIMTLVAAEMIQEIVSLFAVEIGMENCVSVLDDGSEPSNGMLSVPYGGALLAIMSLGTAALMPRRV